MVLGCLLGLDHNSLTGRFLALKVDAGAVLLPIVQG